MESAIDSIVKWAGRQPQWISAALKSIASSTFDHDEVIRIADIAISEAEGSEVETRVVAADLIDTRSSSPSVSLAYIDNVVNVNRLASGERLTFSPNGLTIIYGRNGSGKSGYTRILRQTCRARGGSGQILPNVYESANNLPSTASIAVLADSLSEIFEWNSTSAPESPLKHVNIFDSAAASGAVSDAAAAPFAPYPVRLIEDLGKAIALVRDQLALLASEIESELPEISGVVDESALSQLITQVGNDISATEFLQQIALSAQEETELVALSAAAELLSKSAVPEQIAALQRRSNELGRLKAAIQQLVTLVGSDGIASTESARAQMQTTLETAIESQRLLEGNLLSGVGEQIWRNLWEKARAFSESVAYPGEHFPHTDNDAVCVLCEQPLAAAASARFRRLEEFVSEASQADLKALRDSAAQWANEARLAIDNPLLIAPLELCAAAQGEGMELETCLLELVANGKKLVASSIAQRENGNLDTTIPAALDSADAESHLMNLDQIFTNRRRTLTDLLDSEKQASDRERLALLLERKKVSDSSEEVVALDEARARLTIAEKAKAGCKTNSATNLSGRLSEELITERLRDILINELEELGADRLSVSITKRTDRAVSSFQLCLNSLSGDPLVGEVMSEGELRVLGLAAFFMELRMLESSSAVVFDDPVSSLDHAYREKVARYLAKESLNRQVIIFTHDLVFIDELSEASRLAGTPASISAIQNTATGTGVKSVDLPAAGGDFETQMRHIQSLLSESEPIWDAGDDGAWEPVSRRLAGDLRTAWERGVEDILLFKSIVRFRSSIHTGRLRNVDVTDEHWREMEVAMTELSGKGPHDQATASLRVPLTYPEIVSELAKLRAWKTAVSNNQKVAKTRRDALLPTA
ncbi:AAA family ATPase [uncultured Salinibacterium sp.]|uniref:AAA family ATPase n=1 Tax=uncultured Salinibacterium sp. TaxID=459274 RepID=UPI0030DC3EAC|tara:strand:+ start:11287 stop:13920 length:2634 start_codon:yes stop_codon:yes gene_type:complete